MSRASGVLAVLAVGTALMLAVSPAQASFGRSLLQSATDFPPNCNCIRNSTASPYSLTYLGPQTSPLPKTFSYCFRVDKSTRCDSASKCCNTTQGVSKVEFQADFVNCKSVLRRVTVDGRNHSAWEFNKYGVVRITSLNRTGDDSAGMQVCFIVSTNTTCSQLPGFCGLGYEACKYAIFQTDRNCCPIGITGFFPPPPPVTNTGFRNPPPPPPPPTAVPFAAPPPPVNPFPNCSCDRDTDNSQVKMEPLATIQAVPGDRRNLTKICFRLRTEDDCVNSTSPCCQFDVFKVELDANPACAPALAYSTVDGAVRTRFFQFNPYPTIKITSVNKKFSEVDGTEVCVFMRPECNTLEALSNTRNGLITASVFNSPAEPINCCPTFDTST